MRHRQVIKPSDKSYAIYKYNRLDSSNTYLKQHVEDFAVFSVVWAEQQSIGRGRFTRPWSSVAGKDLTFSVLLPLDNIKKQFWQNIPQITALAVSEILRGYGLQNMIKWPNDVLVAGKKICGILCETFEHEKCFYAVLGVGINVNSTHDDLVHIDLPATSMYNELKRKVPPDDLIVKLVDMILLFFNTLGSTGFSSFREIIKQRLAYSNEQKTVVDGNQIYTGIIADINPDGTLLFRCDDGSLVTLFSGELSFNANR